MSDNDFIKPFADKELKMDSHGRLVIDDPDILSAINGGLMGAIHPIDMATNGACYNSAC